MSQPTKKLKASDLKAFNLAAAGQYAPIHPALSHPH